MAITWRNVEGPSFKEAILAGTAAQQQMSSGFDSFNKILEQETKTNIANWDNTKQNNTQEAMNELMRYRTPEEYQAAQASGAFDALRQRYGAQMDQEAFRTAVDGRLTTLQQRATAGIDFKNKSLADSLRPKEQAALALSVSDPSKLPAYLEANPDLNAFMGGTLAAKGVEGARATDLHRYAGNKDTREGEQLQSTITHQRAIERISQAQAQASLISARAQAVAASNKGSKGGKLYTPQEQQVIAMSAYAKGSLDSEEGPGDLSKLLTDTYGISKDDLAPTLRRINEAFPNGKYTFKNDDGKTVTVGVPVATLAKYVSESAGWEWGITETSLNPWSNYGTRGANKFKDLIKNDKAYLDGLLQADEIINGKAFRDVANKADPEGAKDRSRAQAEEALRGNERTVPNPFYRPLADFPKPADVAASADLLFNPIVRRGLQAPAAEVTKADVILRKQLRESKNPVNGMNLVR